MKGSLCAVLTAAVLTSPAMAIAGELTDWMSIDTYLRGRGMFSGDSKTGSLANTTKLGRLLNESSKLQVDAEVMPMEDIVGHTRIEGETLRGADSGGGMLGAMRLTQTYVEARNVFTDGLKIRVGSADYLMGVMQYYDLKPGRVLLETYGIRADYKAGNASFTAAVGDSGYVRSKGDYELLPTGAIAFSFDFGSTKLFAAAEMYSEMGSRDLAYKVALGAKYSGDGVVNRADTYINLEHTLPEKPSDNDAYSVTAGNELELAFDDDFRLGIGVLATWNYVSGNSVNSLEIAPLARGEYALFESLNMLAEMAYYENIDFSNGGVEARMAWQGKAGLILSPAGIGLLSRPHLRLMYGCMYSSDQHFALGQKDGEHWKHSISAEFEIKF